VYRGNDVSVVIPTYNRPRRLINAVESIKNQSVPVGEIIVVNDGSEQSYTCARHYLNDLSIDTQYIETNGFGAAKARNLGAEYATGEVLMFLDDDDKWRENKVKYQLELFSQNVGLVYSGRIVVDESDNELYKIDGGDTGDLSSEILIRNVIGTTSSPAMLTRLFEEVGGFDEEMPGLQDWELWIRMCQKTLVGYDPTYTVEWLSHSKNTQMTSQPSRYIRAVEMIKSKHNKKYNGLNAIDKRKAKSYQNLSIAKKYSTGNILNKYKYLFKSMAQYPSIATISHMFPKIIIMKLR